MSPLTLQLLAAFACAIVGFIAGVLVTLLWSEKEKKIAEEESAPKPVMDKNRVEVARIWRDKKTGDLLTEVDGKVYKEESELSKTQRSELKYTAMAWAGWVVGSEDVSKPKPEVNPVAVAAVPIIAQPAPLPPVPPPPVRVAAVDAKPEKSGDKKGKAEEPPRPKTMVEQIDEILAEQIKGTPLESRGLRILQNDVGVTVWVGLDHYDGIDGVTDPAIKTAVAKAVETWEKQAGQPK